jgi:hypothetical protein
MTMNRVITIDEIMALKPCYSREKVEALCAKGMTLETLIAISRNDARWLLSHLMTHKQKVEWALASASIASRIAKHSKSAYAAYAAANAAAYAADAYAVDAAICATNAAYAATNAAICATNAAANDAECHKLTCMHALQILGVMPS